MIFQKGKPARLAMRVRKNMLGLGMVSAIALMGAQAGASEGNVAVDIKPQRMDQALLQLARQAGVQIIFPTSDVKGEKSPSVQGDIPVEAALGKILENSRFDFERTSKGLIVVKEKSASAAYSDEMSSGDDVSNNDTAFVLEEIVVTATKRNTSLQDTALSISVLTGGQLEKRGITSLGEVISSVPGVDMPSGAPGNTSIVVRGISTSVFGESPNSTSNQTTSSYLDELPLSLGVADIRMVDLERIEVLKGPQGTLYGQSAMGGVLRYITNKPSTEGFEGKVSGYISDVKNGGISHGLQGHVNVPVSETFAIRAAAYRYDNAGFIDSIGSDIKENANTEETIGGRLSLRWNVTDRITFDATYLRQEIDLGAEQSATNTFTPTPYTFPVVVPSDLTDINLSDPKMQHVNPSTFQDEVISAKLEVEFDAFNAMVLGAKKRADFDALLDTCLYVDLPGQGENGGTFRCPFTSDRDRDIETLELRLTSNEPIASFADWIFGVWYENKDDLYLVDTLDVVEDGDSATLFNAFTFVNGDIGENWDRTFDSNELAFYGEVGLNFTEDLKLTVGYRYSTVETNRETITADGFFDVLIGRDGALGVDPYTKEKVHTFKFNLEYQATDDVLVYALASSGYRAGGFNVGAFPFVPPSTYDSDTLWNYELGAKTSWLDGRLTLNAIGYQIDWNDIQLSVSNPPYYVTVLANAGKARIRGLELESNYYFDSNLVAGFNLSWKNAELRDDYVSSDVVIAAAGSQLPASSKLTYSLYADWSMALTSDMDLNVYAAHRYIGKRQGNLGSLDEFEAYSLTDVKVGVTHVNGVEVSLYADNVFNNIVATNLSRIGSYHLKSAINRPRTIGLRVGYSF